VSSSGDPLLLWTSYNNGQAYWNVSGTTDALLGGLTVGPYSTYASQEHYSSTRIAAGADGTTWVLWATDDGYAQVSLLKPHGNDLEMDNNFEFAPGSNWSAVDITVGNVGNDNNPRILWTNADGGVALWTVDETSGNLLSSVSYGPIAGWTAIRVAAGSDGDTRVLWTSDHNAAALWFVDANNNYLRSISYGPYTSPSLDWTAADVAVDSANLTPVLWTNTDGGFCLWSVDTAGVFVVDEAYGPFSPEETAMSVAGLNSPDAWILLNEDSGVNSGGATIWQMNNTDAFINGTGGAER
jgi:hypothetical protein